MSEMATGFIMSGAGVRQGQRVPLVRMLDVAPTRLLGVELNGATGLPIAGILESRNPGSGLGLGVKLGN
jgi:hypothetical protein